MERERGSKIIAIVALCVGVVGLSLGFAGFSNVLEIKSSASVSPDATTFNVDFSTVAGEVIAGTVTGVADPVTNGPTAGTATIKNNEGVLAEGVANSSIEGLTAAFTAPGQSVTYTFYARNVGEYDAFLNSVVFEDVEGSDPAANKVCAPTTGSTADAAKVAAACEGISISVKVNGITAPFTGSVSPIADTHKLVKGTAEEIVVTIAYASDAARADGDFTVAFGDIVMTYASID